MEVNRIKQRPVPLIQPPVEIFHINNIPLVVQLPNIDDALADRFYDIRRKVVDITRTSVVHQVPQIHGDWVIRGLRRAAIKVPSRCFASGMNVMLFGSGRWEMNVKLGNLFKYRCATS